MSSAATRTWWASSRRSGRRSRASAWKRNRRRPTRPTSDALPQDRHRPRHGDRADLRQGRGRVVNERSGHKRTLHELIGKANGRPRLFRPDVVVSVPSAVTSGERRAVTEAAISAGARQVWLIDEPLAAAMGAGLPIAEVRASAICELGAATTEIAVISRSGTVVEHSLAVGGNDLDRAIARRLSIDERAAEAVKIAVGSAVPLQEPLVTTVNGQEVSSNAVLEAIE